MSFFDDVGAVDIIGGVRRRPRSGISGNVAMASVGVWTMTIALLLSSAAYGGHSFAGGLSGRSSPQASLVDDPTGGRRRRSGDDDSLYDGVISKGWSRLHPSSSPCSCQRCRRCHGGGGASLTVSIMEDSEGAQTTHLARRHTQRRRQQRTRRA